MGRVAEFQKRGAVHFHAIVRLDGPGGPEDIPPAWASVGPLTDAITAAAGRVSVPVTAAGEEPARILRWGDQVDVRPIGTDDGQELTEQAADG